MKLMQFCCMTSTLAVMKMYHAFCGISFGWVRDRSFHSTNNLKKKTLLHLASFLLYLHFSSSFKSSFCFHWIYWSSWDFPEKQCCLHPADRPGVLFVRGPYADCLIPLGDLCSCSACSKYLGQQHSKIDHLFKISQSMNKSSIRMIISQKCIWQGERGGLENNEENTLVTMGRTINTGWVLPMSSILISHLDTFFSIYFHGGLVMYHVAQVCRTENQKD